VQKYPLGCAVWCRWASVLPDDDDWDEYDRGDSEPVALVGQITLAEPPG